MRLSPLFILFFLYVTLSLESYGQKAIINEKLKEFFTYPYGDSDIDFVFPYRYETEMIIDWADGVQSNWKNKYYLALIHWNLGNLDKASGFFSGVGSDPENYISAFDHALSLLRKNMVLSTIEILDEIIILPNEGARRGRELWNEANLIASLKSYWDNDMDSARIFIENAYKWPENMGVGKPYMVDERVEDFIMGMVLTRQG